MVLEPRHQKIADQQYVVGEGYWLTPYEERSAATHDHQFAWLDDAWRNLPEQYQFEPWAQSKTHLRKYALIRTSFCTTEQFPCQSRAEAERWASRLRADDSYCVVTITGTIVNRFRAESQSRRAMDGKRFQASKQAIIEFIEGLLGVEPGTLEREGGKAA